MKNITVTRKQTKREIILEALKSGPQRRVYLLTLTGGIPQAIATLLKIMIDQSQITRVGFGLYKLVDKN